MSEAHSESAGRDQRLNEILAAYLQATETGQPPDEEKWLAAHPDFAAELREFLADKRRIDNIVLPPAADEATLPPTARPYDAVTLPPSAPQPANQGRQWLGKVRYFGEYELLEEIARGGMGVVYKARQSKLNRIVAVKTILAGSLAGEGDVKRFYAEAEAAANLDHPGIVPIYEVGMHEGQHYFSMAFIEGQSLAQRMSDGPLPPAEAAELVRKVAEAVQFAHDRGVIHRDLKPANVLLAKVDRAESGALDRPSSSSLRPPASNLLPKVTDFGLAKKTAGDSNLTGTGQILGTPSYMPPEQAAGRISEVRETADVYSLGAILYATLTGRPPFQADNPLDTLMQVLEREPVAPRTLNPAIPLDLETICLKCLEKDRRRRYASAQLLGEELERFLRGEPILARPVSRLERAWRWCKRQPAIASLIAAVAASLMAGTIISTYFAFEARKQAKAEQIQRANAEEQTKVANRERRRAEKQTRQATAQRLAVQSRAVLREYPQRSLLLAVEAARATSNFKEPIVPAAQQVLRDVLAAVGGQSLGPHAGPLGPLILSNEGDRQGSDGSPTTAAVKATVETSVLVVGGMAPRMWSWREAEQSKLREFSGGRATITCWCVADDQRRLAAGYDDGTLRVWNLSPRAGDLGRELRTNSGRGAPITHLSWSGSGKRLLSGASDGTLCVWDLSAGPPDIPRILNGLGNRLLGAQIGHDGRWVAGFDDRKRALLWNVASLTAPAPPLDVSAGATTHQSPYRLQICPNGRWLIAVGIRGARVGLWDLSKQPTTAPRELSMERGFTLAAVVSTDGKWLATDNPGGDGYLRLWDLTVDDPGAAPLVLRTATSYQMATNARFTSDSRWLTATNGSTTAYLWNLPTVSTTTAPLELSLDRKADFILGIDPQRQLLIGQRVMSVNDTRVSVWSFRADGLGDAPLEFTGHERPITCWAISPSGKSLATGSEDKTIRVWDLSVQPPREPIVLRGHDGRLASVSFMPHDEGLISTSDDGAARHWDLLRHGWMSSPQPLTGYTEMGQSPKLTAGRWLVRTSGVPSRSMVRLWDLKQATTQPVFTHVATSQVTGTTVSGDGKVLAIGSYAPSGGLIHLIRRPPGGPPSEPIVLRGDKTDVTAVQLSSDGRWLLATYHDRAIWLWNLADKKTAEPAPVVLKHPNESLYSGAFSSDGRWLVTRGEPTASLWNLYSEDIAGSRRDLEPSNSFHALLADRPQFLTLSQDHRQARLWDLSGAEQRLVRTINCEAPISAPHAAGDRLALPFATETQVVSLRDPSAPPIKIPTGPTTNSRVRLSPDGRWLTATNESMATLWDLQSDALGEPHGRLHGHAAPITVLEFSPDSRWLLTVSAADTAWLWDLGAADPAATGIQLADSRGPISSAFFAPDSRRLLLSAIPWGAAEHTLDTPPLVELAVKTAGRALTENERTLYDLSESLRQSRQE